MNVCMVFSGGGYKIASHSGMVRVATEEFGLEASMAGGTSAGALAAMMVAQGRLQEFHALVGSFSDSDVQKRRNVLSSAWHLYRDGGAWDNRPLLELIRELWDPSRLQVPLYVCGVQHESGELWTRWIYPGKATAADALYIFASTCIPLVWPPFRDTAGRHHYDGGVRSGLPYGEAVDAGAEHVLLMSCNPEHLPYATGPQKGRAGPDVFARVWECFTHQTLVQDVKLTRLITGLVKANGGPLPHPSKPGRFLRAVECIELWYRGDPGGTLDDRPETQAGRRAVGEAVAREGLLAAGLQPLPLPRGMA